MVQTADKGSDASKMTSRDDHLVGTNEQTPLLIDKSGAVSNGREFRHRTNGAPKPIEEEGEVGDDDVDEEAEQQENGKTFPPFADGAEEDDNGDIDDDSSSGSSIAKSSLHPGGVSGSRFWLVMCSVIFTYYVVIFDSTILASSHPVITSHFGASGSASWLSTAYLLTSTAFQPLAGRLSDSLGRKPPYVAGMAVFLLATLWCALARSIGEFILARAVCGLGGGTVMAIGAICVGDLLPVERRGPYQSILNVTFGVAAMSGAALGGLMADRLGWRWEFGVQLPALALCLGVIALAIPDGLGLEGRKPLTVWETMRAFDLKGSMLLTVLVTFLILGLDLGGNKLPWSHPFIIACFSATAALLPLFLYVESLAKRPVMPLNLVHKAPMANLIFANSIASLLINAILFNVPIFFQAVLLTSATSSGLRLAFPSLISSLAGVATGFLVPLTRGLKWAPLSGSVLLLAGCVVLVWMRPGWPQALYFLCLVPSSLGQGFQFPGTFLALLGATPRADQAVVTTTLQLWRSLGSVAGVSLSGAVLQKALALFLRLYVVGRGGGQEEEKEDVIRRVRESVGAIGGLPEPFRGQVIRSYRAALSVMFGCCAALALVAVLLLLPVRLPRLKAKDDGKGRSEDSSEEDAGAV